MNEIKNLKLNRIVMEVFVAVIILVKCVLNQIQEEEKVLQEKCR